MRQGKEKKYQIVIYVLAVVTIGCVLVYRAFRGMDLTDESYYLATAKRFYDGDMLFREDWNRGQIFGLLMVPFYSLYVFFHGNNEGIILCARILFVFFELFVSAFLYCVLIRNTKSYIASMMAALCVLVYARGNIITFSYYNLGFLTFLLSILCWMKSENSKRKKIYIIFSGFNFSISVLCMPYMVVLLAVLLALGMFWKKRRSRKKQTGMLVCIGNINVCNDFYCLFLENDTMAADSRVYSGCV